MARSSINKARRKTVTAIALSAGFVLCGQDMHSSNEKKNPFAGQKAAIEAGEQRFKSSCTACHGAEAEGGRGPALAGNRDLQGMSDEQLFNTIRQGVPGTGMPPSQMSDEQTWQVAAFVRNLSAPAALAVLPGNSAAGRELFYGNGGCSACHAIHGKGGLLGPDLTDAGANLTVRDLREGILQPNARIAPGFVSTIVVMKNAERIEGVTKDNTNYSMSIIDKTGRLHLIDKNDVSKIEFSRRSLMPDDLAQRLAPEKVDDLVKYLASQTVRSVSDSEQQQHDLRRIH